MINLEFLDADGKRLHVLYNVHPRSREGGGLLIPEGAALVVVWLGTVVPSA